MYRAKDFEYPQSPSNFTANQCQPISPGGQIGWHCLAGISEGHHGNSHFLVPLAQYTYYEHLGTGITEVAFFYHFKFKLQNVN